MKEAGARRLPVRCLDGATNRNLFFTSALTKKPLELARVAQAFIECER
jgi:hypothetical protein